MKIMYSLMNNINMLIIICIVASTITGVFVLAQESSSAIDTLPFLSENVLATGYSGLQLTTQVEQSNMYFECQWKYGNNVRLPIFSFNINCRNRSDGGENLGSFAITCVNNNNRIITSLIVQSPIVSSVVVQMQCGETSDGAFESTISSINLNVTDCRSSSPLAVESTSAIYNSTGTFRCTNNENLYYSNGTEATVPQTTCLATAKWSGEENVKCFEGDFVFARESSSGIYTLPFLSENVLATGYSGLQLTTQVEQSNMYIDCLWKYGNNIQLTIFNFIIACENYTDGGENVGSFAITCVNNSNHIITSLIVQSPIVSLVVVQMQCRKMAGGIFEIISFINLNVTDCTSSSPLAVNSTSATYGSTGTFRCTNNNKLYYINGTQATVPQTTCLATAKWSGEENLECFEGCNVTYPLVVVSNSTFCNSSGTFSCANNGTLFYSNGTQLTSIQTTCLPTAEWSGQNGLGCGKAPDVVINGELTVIEGEDVTLTCDYVDIFPFGNKSAFSFRELTMVLDKGQSFTIPSVKRLDNNKPVSCQALTPFTQIYTESGRSDARSVKVLYAPYQDNPTTCTWLADLSQICKISFSANTNVTLGQITKDGDLVNGIVSPVSRDDDDLVSFQFGLLEVTFGDAGSYQVHLTSIVPPHNYIIYFEIDVVSNPAHGFLIGLICAVVYGVVVSAIAIGQYCKSSKDVKLKDQSVYYDATTSKVNNPIPDGTYITIDDVKSSPAEDNRPTEYLTPNEINSNATTPLPADGYENIIVVEIQNVESKRKLSTKASYENFAGSESKSSEKTKNPTSSKDSDEYEILNPQIAQK